MIGGVRTIYRVLIVTTATTINNVVNNEATKRWTLQLAKTRAYGCTYVDDVTVTLREPCQWAWRDHDVMCQLVSNPHDVIINGLSLLQFLVQERVKWVSGLNLYFMILDSFFQIFINIFEEWASYKFGMWQRRSSGFFMYKNLFKCVYMNIGSDPHLLVFHQSNSVWCHPRGFSLLDLLLLLFLFLELGVVALILY